MIPRVLICGSRNWLPLDEPGDEMQQRILELKACSPSTIVMHGGAPGADWWAGWYAEQAGLPVEVYKADWKAHGKAAGPLRNRQMLDQGPRLVIAFKTGRQSRGTDDTIGEAKRRGFPVEVYTAHRGWDCASCPTRPRVSPVASAI